MKKAIFMFAAMLCMPVFAGQDAAADLKGAGCPLSVDVPQAVASETVSAQPEKEYEYNKRTLEDPVIQAGNEEDDALILDAPPPLVEPFGELDSKGPVAQTPAQRFVAAAKHYIGVPYVLGGDGVHATDCGMFTRMSLIRAGLATAAFPRCADDQYRLAEQGQGRLSLVKGTPMTGDIAFINWHTGQSAGAYKGITHVGIYMGSQRGHYIWMLHASSGEGKVTTQWVNRKAVYAFGRLK